MRMERFEVSNPKQCKHEKLYVELFLMVQY